MTTPLHDAAWPDLFANLQAAYAELAESQFELENRAAEIDQVRDLFERVIESMSEALFLLDRTGRVMRVNRAASALLECPEADLIGRPLSETCGTDAIPTTPWQVLNRAPNGVLLNLDIDITSSAGGVIPVSLSCALVRDKQEKINGVLVVARDITERKRAERAQLALLAREHEARAEAEAARQRLAVLAEALDRALGEAELLNAIAAAAAGEDDLTRILSTSLDRLGRIIRFTGGAIALVEADELVIRAAVGPFAQTAIGQHLSRGQGRSWQVVMTGEPFLSNDITADGLTPTSPIQSFLGVPLIWRDRIFGLLSVDSTETNAFNTSDIALMQKVAAALSGPIELARRYKAEGRALAEAEAAQRRIASLARAGTLLASSLDYEVTLQSVARLIVPELADWCTVDMLDENKALRTLAIAHIDPAKVQWARELRRRFPADLNAARGVAQVLRTGKPEIYPELSDELLAASLRDPEQLAMLRQSGLTSAMIVPLTARGQTLGAITFAMAESGRHYTSDDLALAEQLARRSALAIDNAQLYRETLKAEAELRRQYQLTSAITANVGEGIMALDRLGQITFINPAAEQMLGWTQAEVLGKPVQEVLHLQDGDGQPTPMEDRLLLNAIRAGETIHGEDVFVRKDGTVFPVIVTSSPIMSDEQIVGGVMAFRDTTERKRAEEQLRKSERRFRALIENSSDAVSLIGADSTVLYSSPSTSRVLGYSPEEFVGYSGLELVHPDDREYAMKVLSELVQQPGTVVSVQVRVRHKDGSWRWTESVGTNLLDEPSVQAIVVNYRDITERKQAQEALQQANQKLTGWVKELEERNRAITSLNEMGDLLQTCMTGEEAYNVIAQTARQLFPNEPGALFVLRASQNMVEAVTLWGDAPAGQRVFAPDDCWALRRGRVHAVGNVRSGLVCPHLRRDEARDPTRRASLQSYLCVPMMAQGEAIGILHLQTHAPQSAAEAVAAGPETKPRLSSSSAEHIALAMNAAEHIALALSNLKLQETLRRQAIRDPLTGLFNRRYMEESLEREISRAARRDMPLGIVMLDIDHFKRFNDTFGHAAGDALLRELGTFLLTHLRAEDIACRYGGEEFALILAEASLESTRQRAEQLRNEVKNLNVHHLRRPLGSISLSLGVACFPEHGSTVEAVLRAADNALYRAKAGGRDRVVLA